MVDNVILIMSLVDEWSGEICGITITYCIAPCFAALFVVRIML